MLSGLEAPCHGHCLGSLVTARRSRMNILSPGPRGRSLQRLCVSFIACQAFRCEPDHWSLDTNFQPIINSTNCCKLDTKNFGTNDKKLLIVTKDRDWEWRPSTSQHHCHCTEHSTQYRGSWPHLPEAEAGPDENIKPDNQGAPTTFVLLWQPWAFVSFKHDI